MENGAYPKPTSNLVPLLSNILDLLTMWWDDKRKTGIKVEIKDKNIIHTKYGCLCKNIYESL